MGKRRKCLEEHSDNHSASWMTLYHAPTSNTFRETNHMGRHKSLSGSDPRYTTHLVTSHPLGQEESCTKNGYAGSPPEKEKRSLRQDVSSAIHSLTRPMIDYACPAWKSAARTHVRRLQVSQSKCLRVATVAPW